MLGSWEIDVDPVGDDMHMGHFRNLRQVLSAEYAELPDRELESALDAAFGESTAEDLENFWSSVKDFGGSAAGYLKKAVPGIVQGATAGAALGPMGIVGGALAGGALNIAQQGLANHGAAPAAARAISTGRHVRSSLPKPGGSPAAAQLVNLLSRPELVQALLSMAMGPAGRSTVRLGQTPVPIGAMTNLLGVLTNQAASEYHAARAGESERAPGYLLDESGEFVCDPSSAVDRAGVVLGLLGETSAQDEDLDEADVDAAVAWDMPSESLEDEYDAIELAELYSSGYLEEWV